MAQTIRVFMEAIKFSHTVFALPFALLAASLASVREGGWHLVDLVGILLCMVFARTAAMAFNRWADREVDGRNPRTKGRAIPAGLMSPATMLLFVLFSAVGFVASTMIFWVFRGNHWPALLSGPVLLFLLGYSFSKRFTPLAHVWLGVALALSPVAAWIAIRGMVELSPLLLALGIAFWVTGFDIIYACQDVDADRQLGLHSIPAWLGIDGAMNVARGCHFLMLVVLVLLGMVTPELSRFFPWGVAMVAGLLLYEHWLVRGRDLSKVNLAFLYVNGIVSVGLLLVTLGDLYLPRI